MAARSACLGRLPALLLAALPLLGACRPAPNEAGAGASAPVAVTTIPSLAGSAPAVEAAAVVAAASVAASPAAAMAAAPAAAALAGAANCRFELPAGWNSADVRWTGECSNGHAQGRGVLREFSAGKVARIFFGTLEQGRLQWGAIDQPDGYVAGRFEAGKAVADGERSALIKAFNEASAAAKSVAEGYQKAGNAASAKFYEDKARQLANQMD
jgi:hypothetical protein